MRAILNRSYRNSRKFRTWLRIRSKTTPFLAEQRKPHGDSPEGSRPAATNQNPEVVSKRFLIIGFTVFLGAVLAFIHWGNWPKKVDDEIPSHFDMLVVLGGGFHQGRATLAIEAVEEFLPSDVCVTGDGGRIVNQLRDLSLDGVRIHHEENAISTYENAVFTKPIIEANDARTIVLVTHAYHSARAKRTFQFVMGPAYSVKVVVADESLVSADTEAAMMRRERYAAIYYAIRYGVPLW
ncbi:YdcF family protein [Rhodopirellula sp. JC740]|uniref:YdcF family protein n=1 Tax=Rhodopirellula halodulae TaxID=2894198 RepID=A0ABS8NBD0_9BACT|nr:YdcF family protein [Rhodopirellula sp. JC740]MCC9640868.1 YdcF family protein [Rhodopirellula sp. JC740]